MHRRPADPDSLANPRHRLAVQHAVADAFGASFQAIVYRCHDLGIISDAAYRRMFQTFNEYGWRKPPYEELGALPPSKEHPRRMQRLCFRALSEGMIGESKARRDSWDFGARLDATHGSALNS
jgi:Zn-dependent peptidase ImmA (M78 family)